MAQCDVFKKEVYDTTIQLAEKGLLLGTGGNVSRKVEGEDLLAVTPSGIDYNELRLDQICLVDFQRELVEGELMPSVETGMHISVYQNRPDVNAVIHTHQPYASIFSLIQQVIPALFDEQVANLGREVAVVPYGLSGSNELLSNITMALENQCNAYILQNHGVLVLGLDIITVSRNVTLLEKTAQVYYNALLSGKEVIGLTPEIEETIFSMLQSNQRKEMRRKKKLRREKEKLL